jgi:hypothetical protein
MLLLPACYVRRVRVPVARAGSDEATRRPWVWAAGSVDGGPARLVQQVCLVNRLQLRAGGRLAPPPPAVAVPNPSATALRFSLCAPPLYAPAQLDPHPDLVMGAQVWVTDDGTPTIASVSETLLSLFRPRDRCS